MASPAKAVTNKQGASGEEKSTQRLVLTLKETPDPKQAAKMIIALRNFHVDTLPHWKLTAVHNGRGKGRWVHDRRTKTLFTFVRADDDKRIIREGIEALVEDTAITFSAEGFDDDAAPAAAPAVLATPARAPSAEPPASAPSAAAAGAAGSRRRKRQDDDGAGVGAGAGAGAGAGDDADEGPRKRARRRLTPEPEPEAEQGGGGVQYDDYDARGFAQRRRDGDGDGAARAAGDDAGTGRTVTVLHTHGVRVVERRSADGGGGGGGGSSSSSSSSGGGGARVYWWELRGANTRHVLRQLTRARDDRGVPLFARRGRDERWRSTGPLDRMERDYVLALVRTGCGTPGWGDDNELTPVPDRFRPRNADGSRMTGPIRAGARALPHNNGRWFFRANDDSGILWADGSEPFSETSQARFRAHVGRTGGAAANAAAYDRRGYAIVTRVEERPQWFLDAMFSTGRWGGLMSQNPLSLTRGPGY